MNFYLTTEQELQQGKKIPCNHYHCYRCQYENMWYKETFLNLILSTKVFMGLLYWKCDKAKEKIDGKGSCCLIYIPIFDFNSKLLKNKKN